MEMKGEIDMTYLNAIWHNDQITPRDIDAVVDTMINLENFWFSKQLTDADKEKIIKYAHTIYRPSPSETIAQVIEDCILLLFEGKSVFDEEVYRVCSECGKPTLDWYCCYGEYYCEHCRKEKWTDEEKDKDELNMEMKAMPSAMDALLDVRDGIVRELKYLEKMQRSMNEYFMGDYFMAVNKRKKSFLIALYNMLPDEVEEGVIKREGEEEWHEN